MTPPRFLIGTAVIFWGWFTGLLIAAVPVAIIIEAAAFCSVRFDLDDKDFRRIGDLCLWVFAGLGGYAVLDTGLPSAVVQTITLLPLAGLPLVLGQTYSTTETLRLDVLLRLGGQGEEARGANGSHCGYVFLALCLLAAAAANVRTPWFYAGSIALCAWALWTCRSPRNSRLTWIMVLGAVAACGYAGQIALAGAQSWLVESTMEFFAGSETDPYRSTTEIGHIGELKLSDQILVRVVPDRPLQTSFLLHRASYDSYAGGSWFARDAKLEPITADESGTSWTLHPDATPNGRATIYSPLNRGKGVLALPSGTRRLEGLVVDELKQNRHGTVRIEKAAPIARYTVRFRPGSVSMAAPSDKDLKIPNVESRAVTTVLGRLDLQGQSSEAIVQRIVDHFSDHFAYSIYQSEGERGQTPIRNFLQGTRAGHCEHFATATVLLLRAAGIPARYATGYSVQEYSELEDAYIVRERHAHAWTRYYLNGAWHDLDTTPSVWAFAEAERASVFEPLMDWLSWIYFRFDRWRASGDSAGASPWWLLLSITLIAYVPWRLRLFQRRRAHRVAVGTPEISRRCVGADSDFCRIGEHMLERGLGRDTAEPVTSWLRRLEREGIEPRALFALGELVSLHYRYRFDPTPLPDVLRSKLARGVSEWLYEHAGERDRALSDRVTRR